MNTLPELGPEVIFLYKVLFSFRILVTLGLLLLDGLFLDRLPLGTKRENKKILSSKPSLAWVKCVRDKNLINIKNFWDLIQYLNFLLSVIRDVKL